MERRILRMAGGRGGEDRCHVVKSVDGCYLAFGITCLFDISSHSGIVFWAKSPAGNTIKVQIANNDSVPAGGKCGRTDASTDGCWDSFTTHVSPTDKWQKYEVKFSELRQDGWGYPVLAGKLDATTARAINSVVNDPASATAGPVTADFWIDDVYFE